jgi:hypothetical protein
MTDEERKRLEEKAMEEERRREALREKEPNFKLYCILDARLNSKFSNEADLSQIIKKAFENEVGDDNDRWAALQENFDMGQQTDVFEEYDGLNSEDAQGLLMVVHLPLLSRGHAIQCHVLHNENIMVQVPNIYNLLLGLPLKV